MMPSLVPLMLDNSCSAGGEEGLGLQACGRPPLSAGTDAQQHRGVSVVPKMNQFAPFERSEISNGRSRFPVSVNRPPDGIRRLAPVDNHDAVRRFYKPKVRFVVHGQRRCCACNLENIHKRFGL